MLSPELIVLLDRLHIPHTQSILSTTGALDALMNVALHTLGAVALLRKELRKRQDSNICSGLYEDRGGKILSDAKINAFSYAVGCFLTVLKNEEDEEEECIPPVASLLMESYPDESVFAKPQWNFLSWHFISASDKRIINSSAVEPLALASSLVSLKGPGLPLLSRFLSLEPSLAHERDRFDCPPLFYTVACKDSSSFRLLLSENASSIDHISSLGCRVLHHAARFCEDVETFKDILAADSNAVKHADAEECLPIHYCARYNIQVSIFEALVQAYPESVDLVDGVGRFPIHHAAISNKSLPMLQAVVTSNPSALKVYTSFGRLALHVSAVFNPHLASNVFIYENYPYAVQSPSLPHGRMPLHESVWLSAKKKVVEFFLSVYPMAATVTTSEGHYPLHFLLDTPYMNFERMECLRLLLKHCPQAAIAVDNDNETPVSITMRQNHGPQVLRLLLRANPTYNPQMLRDLNWKARRTALLLSHRGEDPSSLSSSHTLVKLKEAETLVILSRGKSFWGHAISYL